MRKLIRLLIISRLRGTVCLLWLCAAGPAWAGDGGSSLASLASNLNALCNAFFGAPCPPTPTITQNALEYAAQFNLPTDIVRVQNGVGNALVAANPPLSVPTKQSPLDWSQLTPFASTSATSPNGQAAAGYSSNANSYFFAVTSGLNGGQPDTLHLRYDDLFRDHGTVVQGQDVADISIPMVVLNAGAERVVPTKLKLVASCTGGPGCVTTTTALATGNFSGTGTATYSADQLGLSIAASFGPSSISTQSHLSFYVDAPLIVTTVTDPGYFFSTNPFITNAFNGNEMGFKPGDPKILGSATASIGIAPFPAPLCPGNVDCSLNPPEPGVFGYCASLPNNSNGPNSTRLPAVAAFLAIANSGETIVSAPFGSSSKIVCP
jgi:hypothetical protein